MSSITCAVYNHDGTEIIASYNDEDIYLFKTETEDGSQFHKKFQGHLNSATGLLLLPKWPGLDHHSGKDCGVRSHLLF